MNGSDYYMNNRPIHSDKTAKMRNYKKKNGLDYKPISGAVRTLAINILSLWNRAVQQD